MTEASLPAAPHPDEARLAQIIQEILATGPLDPRGLDRILRRHPKGGRGFFRKREILAHFRAHAAAGPLAEERFAERLRTCPTRSLSGVTPVTVLTRPHPCPGRCVFCPSDVRMPKSYLAQEPGCQRAQANRFDPYLQTWARLEAYRQMGHPTAKVELLVLGGTWSHYPGPYQRWFLMRCLEALEDFAAGRDRRQEVVPADDFATLRPVPGRSYNQVVSARLAAAPPAAEPGGSSETADWAQLGAAQRSNERCACRCVGLVLETRPDCIDPAEVRRLRRLGATKVQLGVQSLSDEILAANQRGHDVASTRRALAQLRAAGFKLQVHWMLNLLGATPETDREDFARLFADPAIRPDELKVYPCSLVETSQLVEHHARGLWRPYEREELLALLADCLASVPGYCRVSRVIRDIPSPDIRVGNRETNLREAVETRLAGEARPLREIRSREVRGRSLAASELRLAEQVYASSVGEEHFLELLTPDAALAGFLRLTLPRRSAGLSELRGAALLREVHVYGSSTPLGRRTPGRAQHAGLGRRLVERGAALAAGRGFPRLAVISAMGTRPWYRRLGFSDGALYQHLTL